jgi:hypothetical protein
MYVFSGTKLTHQNLCVSYELFVSMEIQCCQEGRLGTNGE